ncbi:MAG TPA: adenosylmethionine--8-amino-7-oxononanoate transaminase [Planctomycetota bacterium]
MRSRSSESWRARDRAVLWHPFTQQTLWNEEAFPVIAKGKGAWLEDVDGHKYLDGVSSLWCNIHGHGRPEINRAMKAQLDRVAHATFLGMSNPPAIELGERLAAIAPKGLTRVFYSDNGSTAVEVACKMAFQYWSQNGKPNKRKFVAFDAGYHGDTLGAVSLGGIDLFHGLFRPLLFPTIKAPTTYAYRCDKSRTLAECGSHVLEEVEAILRTHGRETAGLVVEPLVQGAGGMITQPPGFLKALRGLCDDYDVLLIADEVMTGFGRTGTMFACEQEGVSPDLMALSKGLTNGYLPLAATLATERIYAGFLGAFKDRRTFYHGHTYTGNPLACAGALASLDIFRREKTLEKTAKKIHKFGNLLQEFYRIERVGEIRQCGLIAGIELVADPKTRAPFPWEARTGHRVALEARKRGALLRPLGDTLVLMPPLAISERDLSRLVDIALESVRAVLTN